MRQTKLVVVLTPEYEAFFGTIDWFVLASLFLCPFEPEAVKIGLASSLRGSDDMTWHLLRESRTFRGVLEL